MEGIDMEEESFQAKAQIRQSLFIELADTSRV